MVGQPVVRHWKIAAPPAAEGAAAGWTGSGGGTDEGGGTNLSSAVEGPIAAGCWCGICAHSGGACMYAGGGGPHADTGAHPPAMDQCMPGASGRTLYSPLSTSLLACGRASNCSTVSARCARIQTIVAAASFLTLAAAQPCTAQPVSARSSSASATVVAVASFSALHRPTKVVLDTILHRLAVLDS